MNDHIDGETYYWIDALCINQDDLDEKTEQVQRMWQIYENAGLVIIWLGPEDENTVKAFRVLLMVELKVLPLALQQGSSKEAVKKMESPSLEDAAAVARLTHNEYFKRVWIVQELLNTQCPLLVSGDWGSSYEQPPLVLRQAESRAERGIPDRWLLGLGSRKSPFQYTC
jgi:hypothetical protein